ncbi:MAG: dihydroorotase [Spirochaeta sp. LUC14_002_19_P3]|nr:MAG: dihydroorotase [Spirochaeta sp. LUC14_002_19_P3]
MQIELPLPDDWHVHLRQGAPMAAYARAHGASFGRILAMPNTIPPLVGPEDITAYSRKAEAAAPGLKVLSAFRLMPRMSRADIAALAAAGIPAGKYYPDGATTNSQGGLTSWRDAAEAIAAMEEFHLILCIHGENPDAPVLDREAAFLPIFEQIRQAHPQLKMILEHVSSAEGVHAVRTDSGPSAATVTVQHLLFTLDDLIGGLLNPHLFCKPVVKTQAHRAAIQEAVLSGHPRFFFGSDSAPHDKKHKHSDTCPAGAYTAPMILPALASFFHQEDALNRLKPFLCDLGREFYGLPPNRGTVLLEKKPWTVPAESEGCVPLMAGETLPWRIAEVNRKRPGEGS